MVLLGILAAYPLYQIDVNTVICRGVGSSKRCCENAAQSVPVCIPGISSAGPKGSQNNPALLCFLTYCCLGSKALEMYIATGLGYAFT